MLMDLIYMWDYLKIMYSFYIVLVYQLLLIVLVIQLFVYIFLFLYLLEDYNDFLDSASPSSEATSIEKMKECILYYIIYSLF